MKIEQPRKKYMLKPLVFAVKYSMVYQLDNYLKGDNNGHKQASKKNN